MWIWVAAAAAGAYLLLSRPAAGAAAGSAATMNPLARLLGARRPTTIMTGPPITGPAGRSDLLTAQLAAGTAGAGGAAIATLGLDVAADAQFLGGVFNLISGGGRPVLSHAVREAREVQQVGGVVQTMITEIGQAQTADQLWATLLKWQSGYVGGTSSVAVSINFPDNDTPKLLDADVVLPGGYTSLAQYQSTRGYPIGSNFPVFPVGNPNATYPVLTKAAFFKYVQAGIVFRANTQAGVTAAKLDPINIAVANAILNQLDTLGWGT